MVVVTNPQGLHARPADLFVKVALRFTCRVDVIKQNLRVNGKSILDILTLNAPQGTSLCLEAVGDDADRALEALVELIESDFAEPEVEHESAPAAAANGPAHPAEPGPPCEADDSPGAGPSTGRRAAADAVPPAEADPPTNNM